MTFRRIRQRIRKLRHILKSPRRIWRRKFLLTVSLRKESVIRLTDILKKCPVSNTKRSAFVSPRGSFSTACFLWISYGPFTLAIFAAISALFRGDLQSPVSTTGDLNRCVIASSLHGRFWNRRKIALEITAKIAGVNGPWDRANQTPFWFRVSCVPISLNCPVWFH